MAIIKQASFSVAVLMVFLLMVGYSLPHPEVEIMPQFARIGDLQERKQTFIDFMRPIVEAENNRIMKQRIRILRLKDKQEKGAQFFSWELDRLQDICREYKVDCTKLTSGTAWQELIVRIDQVPINLAIAQSAAETAWGTSRFAVAGNAMFGQRTYSKSTGMLPKKRPAHARYKVATFSSVSQSVRSYLGNLNTHWAYESFRFIRQRFREQGIQPDGYNLANGLVRYSVRRFAYVTEIQTIIENNRVLMELQ